MFKRKYISIFLLIILIFSLTGCGGKVDNTGAIITRLEVESVVNGETEIFVIGQHYNYKKILDKSGKEISHEEFYWENDKKTKLSVDLASAGFYEWDSFKSNNRAMSDALKLKVNATLSNGNKIKVNAYGDMPQGYHQVIKFLKIHFD